MSVVIFNRSPNTGKKYFKQKDRENADLLFAEQADDFNKWFNANFKELEKELSKEKGYDKSYLTATYLKIYENILYKGTEVTSYKGLFITSFHRIVRNDEVAENKKTPLEDWYDAEDQNDTEVLKELNEWNKELINKMFDFVYSNYPKDEFQIFKMYINLQPNVSYESLAKLLKLKYWHIQRVISTILSDLKENRDNVKKGKLIKTIEAEPKRIDKTYNFSNDYDQLWTLRIWGNDTIICTVEINGTKRIATMTPNGEIFDNCECYTNLEDASKREFIKQCNALKVEFLKPTQPEAVQQNLFE